MALNPSSASCLVRRQQPELIFPAKPTPAELKKLSDIDDQEGLRFQVSFIMFYRSLPSMKRKDPVGIIRKALCEALVYYYPFAGRIIEGTNRKLMVDCNGEGILFIEADADLTIEQFGDSMQRPYPFIEDLLYDVPGSSGIIGCPLLLIQVTRLACGGFILAVRLNHAMSDSFGLAQFLNATAEIAREASLPSLLPVWQREILCARNPPQVTCMHHEYMETNDSSSSSSIMTLDQPSMVHRSFFFGPSEIKSIRKLLPPHLRKCTTYELLTACLWRCRTRALQLDDPNAIVLISVIINVGINQALQLPVGYYGNSFVFPAAISRAKLLCKNPIGYAVELVKKSKNKVSEEYIRSVADLMVIKGRPHYTTDWNFLVADTSHVGLADVDFGWGKPVYGGPVGAYPNMTIFARFKNSKGENGVVAPIWLPKRVMERFQDELLKLTKETADAYCATMQPSIASNL